MSKLPIFLSFLFVIFATTNAKADWGRKGSVSYDEYYLNVPDAFAYKISFSLITNNECNMSKSTVIEVESAKTKLNGRTLNLFSFSYPSRLMACGSRESEVEVPGEFEIKVPPHQPAVLLLPRTADERLIVRKVELKKD